MADVKTATRQNSVAHTQFSDGANTAVLSGGSGSLVDNLRSQLNEILNNPKLEPIFLPIEKNYNVKREQVAYGVLALIGLYLIFGSAAQLFCNIIGFGYPAYISVKAIRTEDKSDDTQWLVYWTVFATFSLFDFFAESIMRIFPIYYLLKASFLLYLYLPQTNGAAYVYQHHVEPLMLKVEKIVQDYMKQKSS